MVPLGLGTGEIISSRIICAKMKLRQCKFRSEVFVSDQCVCTNLQLPHRQEQKDKLDNLVVQNFRNFRLYWASVKGIRQGVGMMNESGAVLLSFCALNCLSI